MLWTIIAILFALWLLGLIAHVGGGLIHLLLVVALVVFVVNLLTGRRTVVGPGRCRAVPSAPCAPDGRRGVRGFGREGLMRTTWKRTGAASERTPRPAIFTRPRDERN